ncbi:MAG: response regulator [Pseudomonadota bacterium]
MPAPLLPRPSWSARFEPDLERVYQLSLDIPRRGTTRIVAALGLLLQGVTTFLAVEQGAADSPLLLVVFGLLPAAALVTAIWASWRPFFPRVHQPLVVASVLLMVMAAQLGIAGPEASLDTIIPRTAELVLILMILHGLTFLRVRVVCGTSVGVVLLAVVAQLLRGGLADPGMVPAGDATRAAVEALLVLASASAVGCLISVGQDRHLRDLFLAREAMARQMRSAEDAARAKGEFLANMSHEIRTPLNAVIGLAHLALDSDPSEPQRDYLRKIGAAGAHLLGIVNDILDFSKIEADRLTIERAAFELEPMLAEVATLLRERARRKGVALVLDLDPAVPAILQGDPLRLRQILVNLGSNALKFTSEGLVTLRVASQGEASEARRLLIEVSDTGIGMGPEEQVHLFESYWQASPSTTRRFGGTGLGLAITQRLVTLLGGTISVESAPGVGSTFRVVLPLECAGRTGAPAPAVGESGPPTPVVAGEREEQADAPGRDARPPAAPLDARGARVLVVEDDPLNQVVARELLARAGFTVDLASDGGAALRMVQQRRYDAVMMDLRLPVLDGLEVTRRIRRSWPEGTLPIIAMTASAMASDRAECAQAGMDAYVAKPIEPRELWGALGAWFKLADRPPESSRRLQALVEVPGLDPRAGLARVQGDERLYLDLLARLVGAQQEAGPAMLAALEAGDGDTAARQAHTLKGLLATLGAEGLGGQAGEIEELIGQGAPTAALAGEILRFSADFGGFLEALGRVLPRPGVPPSAARDPARLELVCTRLRALLEDDDTEATRLLEAEEALLRAALPEAFEALHAAVLSYDFGRALALLARVCREPTA